jgi:serine/threonine protein kinase
MEWLDGHDLEEQLTAWEAAKQYGDTSHLLSILKPLTQTLERAHDMGLVHRDIKPANIFLIDAPPRARLLDFGLSRMKSAAPLTAVGMVLGSPSYIAPETWRGNSTELDGRADLFALAVIVFRWLTGQLPFDAADLIAKMTAVTSGPRPSVIAGRPDLPAAVDAWMARALAIEPSERFQTGSSFFNAFEAALRGEPWPKDNPESSGVRAISTRSGPAEPTEPTERKSALATAWGAATSLLKRLGSARKGEGAESETPEPGNQTPAVAASLPPVTEPIDDSPASERTSVWLDSAELEELSPSSSLAPPDDALVSSGSPAEPSPDGPSSPDAASPPRKGKDKPQSKAKKAKAKKAKKAKGKANKASKPGKKRKAHARKRKG